MGGVTLKQKLSYMVNMGAIDPKNAIKKGAPIGKTIQHDLHIDPVYVGWIQNLLDKRKSS